MRWSEPLKIFLEKLKADYDNGHLGVCKQSLSKLCTTMPLKGFRLSCETDPELCHLQFNPQDGKLSAVQSVEFHAEFLVNVVKTLHAHISNCSLLPRDYELTENFPVAKVL